MARGQLLPHVRFLFTTRGVWGLGLLALRALSRKLSRTIAFGFAGRNLSICCQTYQQPFLLGIRGGTRKLLVSINFSSL